MKFLSGDHLSGPPAAEEVLEIANLMTSAEDFRVLSHTTGWYRDWQHLMKGFAISDIDREFSVLASVNDYRRASAFKLGPPRRMLTRFIHGTIIVQSIEDPINSIEVRAFPEYIEVLRGSLEQNRIIETSFELDDVQFINIALSKLLTDGVFERTDLQL